MSLTNARLGHSYHLLHPLGGAGTGQLYLARPLHGDEQVVVRLTPLASAGSAHGHAPRRMERLVDEKLLALAQLVHPRVVPILDSGQETIEQQRVFSVVTPYYPAGSLADHLAGRAPGDGRQAPADVASIIAQVAEALHALHEHGVVHQGVRPSNLLLTHRAFPDVQLADAGLGALFATLCGQGLSQIPSVRGAAAYIAPEQWEGQAEAASDQYALAVLAFALLTGQVPFQGSLSQIIAQHQRARPPAPSQLNHQLGASVDVVIEQALARQSAQRFPSVLAFARAFVSALPPAPAPPGARVPEGERPVPSPELPPPDPQAHRQAGQPRLPVRRGLLVVVLAALVLFGSGTLLCRGGQAASSPHTISQTDGSPASGSGTASVVVQISPTAPGQAPVVSSDAPATRNRPAPAGITPTPAPTPTFSPPAPTPTPHGCDIHYWSLTLSPTYAAGGHALYVSAYCHGDVFITLTSVPPAGGHEVDMQICYGLRTTRCSNWVRYAGAHVWLTVATG